MASASPVQAAPAPALPAPPPPPEPALSPAVTAPMTLVAPKAAKTESRAALLLPLSGPQAATGQALSNAAQLALFEIADAHFSLIPLDTKGTAEGAAAAMGQAMAQGADIILGPVFSFEVKAAAPLAQEHMLPMLAFTTDATVAGNGIYALGYLPGPQVARVISYARDQGRRRIAVLARSDEYGRAVADASQLAASSLGVDLVAVEFYDPAQTDFTALVKRLAARRPAPGQKSAYDAILIADEGVRLRNLSSLLSYYLTGGEPPRLLGTLLWDDPRLVAEPSLIGGWYPAPPSASYEAFEQRYSKAFGPMPARVPGLLAGIAYDATALAALMARQGRGEYSMEALQSPLGFLGAGGLFRLTPAGLAERGLAIREITPQGAREIAPAPATF
ncbi:penicillin-binding protein activator [Magnetospirillum molischianum]|uniref:ABC-type branched-chain amino acid transport systems, periplasmic component n=1 Tax=Magnetospirillum molischianum DSM 120 TaxID=1150626 RepID=H8FTZ1_MAGML|nr:penicillin-binding protein activator [Magnetospirillum molischianum]CCG41715.1 ABC-type branched-chain amino acid transport systems, periplasmic component [Magnetospirillum molischianum DSM 120]